MPNRTAVRWVPATVVAAVAVFEFVILASDGQLLLASCVGVLLLVLAWWQSPLRFGKSVSHRAAEEYRGTGGVVIYWRPGCWYCSRLRVSLGRTGREAIWVNVWADPAASDFVRGLHRGDEIVPTVLVEDTVLTNPDPAQVRQRLQASRSA